MFHCLYSKVLYSMVIVISYSTCTGRSIGVVALLEVPYSYLLEGSTPARAISRYCTVLYSTVLYSTECITLPYTYR